MVPRSDKITVDELAEDLRVEYRANKRRSADRLELSLAHLLRFFGGWRAARVTTTAPAHAPISAR